MVQTHAPEVSRLLLATALAAALLHCASYEGVDHPHTFGPAEDGGFGGTDSTAAAGSTSGGASVGGGGTGSQPSGGDGGTAVVPSGGSAGMTGSSGAPSGGNSSMAGSSGSSNNAGTTGNAGSAGSSGGSGTAGAGGTSGGVETLLSQGKPATADSEETLKGNLAPLGNDGVTTTRWCANNGALNHYWQVDLGASHTLSKLQVTWEKAVVYQFKVEGSADGTTWAPLVDQTQSTNATPAQTYPLAAAPTARFVRVTTTGLPSTTVWASFFEFGVYGY